jgi:hypothetical protein
VEVIAVDEWKSAFGRNCLSECGFPAARDPLLVVLVTLMSLKVLVGLNLVEISHMVEKTHHNDDEDGCW